MKEDENKRMVRETVYSIWGFTCRYIQIKFDWIWNL